MRIGGTRLIFTAATGLMLTGGAGAQSLFRPAPPGVGVRIGAGAGGGVGAPLPDAQPGQPGPAAAAPAPQSGPYVVESPAGPGAVAPSAQPAPQPLSSAAEAVAPLRGVSLFAVVPPPPRHYQAHDLVQIIINESSVQKFQQSLDTKKDYALDGKINRLPDVRRLLELQLGTGDSTPEVEVGGSASNKFKGTGTAERNDRFTTRLSAEVIEVKPNGTLLIEAKKVTQSDDEATTLVISGVCRPEDVTSANTVQSGQLTNLVIRTENDGDVRAAAKKGLIPRVFDTIFNF